MLRYVCTMDEHSCEKCRALNGKLFTEDAVREFKMPKHEGERKCRCYFVKANKWYLDQFGNIFSPEGVMFDLKSIIKVLNDLQSFIDRSLK